MTRKECEIRIAKHMEAIIGIAKEYNPECKYLVASYVEQGGKAGYQFNNAWFEHGCPDAKLPIDFHKIVEKKKRAENVLAKYDFVTDTYSVLVDGKVEYEHLAQDEVVEIMKHLTT